MFLGLADNLWSAKVVRWVGLKPLVPKISRLRYFPDGSFTTRVPLKSIIKTRVLVLAYACFNARRLRRSSPNSASRANIESGELSPIVSIFELWSVASFKSRNTLRVHSPLGHVETKSISRTRRASRSLTDMDNALSIEVTHIWTSYGLTRNAPLRTELTAENSDAITTPGSAGSLWVKTYSNGRRFNPSLTGVCIITCDDVQMASRWSMGKTLPTRSS